MIQVSLPTTSRTTSMIPTPLIINSKYINQPYIINSHPLGVGSQLKSELSDDHSDYNLDREITDDCDSDEGVDNEEDPGSGAMAVALAVD